MMDLQDEVTRAMIEAGQQAWARLHLDDLLEYDPSADVLEAVFMAMISARIAETSALKAEIDSLKLGPSV